MSKLVKSHRLILDNQAYQLAPQVIPLAVEEPLEMELHADEDGESHSAEPPVDIEALVQARLDEAEEEARVRLMEAEQDREAILQDAYGQAETIRDTAREEGYESGRQAGFDEGRSIAEALIQEALAVKEALLQRKEAVVRAIEEDTVQLIVDTVERILGKHVQEDYDLVLGIVRSAMAKLTYTESLTLRVSSEDYDMALSLRDQILALAENVDDILIKADKSLRQGSCVLDATSGSIDSSIWTQFEHIKQSFEEMLASE